MKIFSSKIADFFRSVGKYIDMSKVGCAYMPGESYDDAQIMMLAREHEEARSKSAVENEKQTH